MMPFFNIKKFSLLLWFVLFLTILVILPFGCSKKITDDNKNINVALSARLTSTEMVHLIDHAQLTITSYSRNTTTKVELLINGNYLEGEISGVPAGENLFVAEAFNETGRVIYRGQTKATVTADAIANIEFDLYPQVPLLKLSPRAVEIEIEQSFSLTAKIFHVENLSSISFRVSYDNNYLKYDSALLHPDLTTLSSNITLDSQLNTSIPLSDLDLTVVSPDSLSIVDNNGNASIAVIFFSARRQVTMTEITIEPILLENTDGMTIDTADIDLETDLCQVQIKIPFEDFIVDFPDYNLETVIRDEIQKPDGDIYASELLVIDYLYADSSNIADLSGLEHCTYLRGLHLSKNQISSISPLASFTKLQMLSLSYNQITDITPLSELTGITYLTLNDNQISILSALSDLTVLQRLQLSNNQISDISPLSGLTNIRWLFLRSNLIENIGTAFSGMTNLLELHLDYNQLSNITPLSDLTNLQNLTLTDNQITDISPLAGLTNLQSLYLGKNQISDINPLASLTSLVTLFLQNNEIDNLSALSSLANLTYIRADNNQISDLGPLSELSLLNTIYLSENSISDLRPLQNLTNLFELFLYFNQIESVAPLANLSNLEHINLENNLITNIDSLGNLSLLQELWLGNNSIRSTDSLYLLTNLTRLGLENNAISYIGSLEYLTELYDLHLNENQIEDISPLVNNSGLASGDYINLQYNPLSMQAKNEDIPTLEARGVTVIF